MNKNLTSYGVILSLGAIVLTQAIALPVKAHMRSLTKSVILTKRGDREHT